MTTLIFVRHGVTAENLAYVLLGKANPPLHPLGRLQAAAVAEALARQFGPEVDSIVADEVHDEGQVLDEGEPQRDGQVIHEGEPYREGQMGALFSSPLRRCLETAQPIADALSIPIIPSLALRELDFGIVDGMSSFRAYELYQSLMDEALAETVEDFRFPSGESRVEVLSRFENFLQQVVSDYPDGIVCVVTHGGPLGLWFAKLQHRPLGEFRHLQPHHASVTKVTWANGEYNIDVRGSTDHLPQELQAAVRAARESAMGGPTHNSTPS